MIKALFWCFLVLFSQLWLLRWVDGRVLGMQFGEQQEKDSSHTGVNQLGSE